MLIRPGCTSRILSFAGQPYAASLAMQPREVPRIQPDSVRSNMPYSKVRVQADLKGHALPTPFYTRCYVATARFVAKKHRLWPNLLRALLGLSALQKLSSLASTSISSMESMLRKRSSPSLMTLVDSMEF